MPFNFGQFCGLSLKVLIALASKTFQCYVPTVGVKRQTVTVVLTATNIVISKSSIFGFIT
jgi:hypothetical protein